MHFLPEPSPPEPPPPRDRRWWTLLLFASAAATALATRGPWIRVKFERLFDSHLGPPGWQSTAGFTCLCTSLLVAVMTLAESGSPLSRQAVRPGSSLLTGLALVSLLLTGREGPGQLLGVTATWTFWYYLACASVPVLATICALRWLAASSRPRSR